MESGFRSDSIGVVRAITCLMLVLFALACYGEWSYEPSTEALQYQNDYPDTIRSGLDWTFGLSKLALGVGLAAGLWGSMLAMLSKPRAFISLAASAPLMAVGAQLNAAPSAYPSVEPMFLVLLWCGAAAAWASAVTLTWLVLARRNG